MKLKEVSVNSGSNIDNELEFNGNCQGVAHALTISFLGFDNSHVKKIAIEFCNSSEETNVLLTADNICIVKNSFNFTAYQNMSEIEKLKFIFSESIEALKIVFDDLGIDNREILDQLLSDDLIDSNKIEFIWSKGKKWSNRKRELFSEIFYYFENGVLTLGARVISNSDDTIIKEEIWDRFPPHYMFISHLLGTVKWTSQNELNLFSKDKETFFSLVLD